MELSSSDKERIQHQYDALAKKTLVGEAKSHRRTLAKRAAREVPFSDLSESELAQLFTTDEYKSDYFRFQVSGFDVLVKNELLAEALNALPERKRDISQCPYPRLSWPRCPPCAGRPGAGEAAPGCWAWLPGWDGQRCAPEQRPRRRGQSRPPACGR